MKCPFVPFPTRLYRLAGLHKLYIIATLLVNTLQMFSSRDYLPSFEVCIIPWISVCLFHSKFTSTKSFLASPQLSGSLAQTESQSELPSLFSHKFISAIINKGRSFQPDLPFCWLISIFRTGFSAFSRRHTAVAGVVIQDRLSPPLAGEPQVTCIYLSKL